MKDATAIGKCLAVDGDNCKQVFQTQPTEWTHSSALWFPCRLMSSHSHPTHEISKDTNQRNDGVDNDCKYIYRYVAVAAYFRVFVLLRDARGSVDASASAPEEALELLQPTSAPSSP